MRRRELMLLLGAAMTAASALRAQQKAMLVISFLGSTSRGPNAANLAAFRQGLSETRYVEGPIRERYRRILIVAAGSGEGC